MNFLSWLALTLLGVFLGAGVGLLLDPKWRKEANAGLQKWKERL